MTKNETLKRKDETLKQGIETIDNQDETLGLLRYAQVFSVQSGVWS